VDAPVVVAQKDVKPVATQAKVDTKAATKPVAKVATKPAVPVVAAKKP
jgi:hypothetical protein